MEKVCAILLLCSMVIALPLVRGIDESPDAVEKWFQNHSKMKEKVTKLHFYLHDQWTGKNPTAVRVAQANTTSQSPTLFGSVVVIDDALTTGPEPNSTVVGRAQGSYAMAGLNEAVVLMSMNFVFSSGKHNGSALSILGRNPALHPYRELPIVGGSGVFRLARGIATAKTYFFNNTNGDAIVEYNVAIPVVPTVRVVITFTKFVELQPTEQFYTPFSSPRHLVDDGPSTRSEEDSETHYSSFLSTSSASTSSSSFLSTSSASTALPRRSTSRLSSASKFLKQPPLPPPTVVQQSDPFAIPSGYSWSSFDEKSRKMKKSKSIRKTR